MELYLVTVNGWTNGYGVEEYVIGIFDDESTAERVAKENQVRHGNVVNDPRITKLNLNDVCGLKPDECFDYSNRLYIGGYIE